MGKHAKRNGTRCRRKDGTNCMKDDCVQCGDGRKDVERIRDRSPSVVMIENVFRFGWRVTALFLLGLCLSGLNP